MQPLNITILREVMLREQVKFFIPNKNIIIC
jgi:hypothetical protein